MKNSFQKKEVSPANKKKFPKKMKNDPLGKNRSNRKKTKFKFFKNLIFDTVVCPKKPILSQALF
jgi:hypothetical protein